MTIDVVATSDFIHGKLEMAKRGEASLPEQLAKDLQAAGLVVLAVDAGERKAAPPVTNKMAPPARNKVAKLNKFQPSAPVLVGDAGAQAGASADVCTDKPGVVVEGAASEANAAQTPADPVEVGGDAGSIGSVAPGGSAADGATA